MDNNVRLNHDLVPPGDIDSVIDMTKRHVADAEREIEDSYHVLAGAQARLAQAQGTLGGAWSAVVPDGER